MGGVWTFHLSYIKAGEITCIVILIPLSCWKAWANSPSKWLVCEFWPVLELCQSPLSNLILSPLPHHHHHLRQWVPFLDLEATLGEPSPGVLVLAGPWPWNLQVGGGMGGRHTHTHPDTQSFYRGRPRSRSKEETASTATSPPSLNSR